MNLGVPRRLVGGTPGGPGKALQRQSDPNLLFASPDQIAAAVVASVREHIGPVAALKSVVCVPALPKTRSGKILRRSMRAIAEGREEPVPSTIEDPKVLETITPYLLGD